MFNSESGQPHHGLVIRDAIQPEVPCDCQHPPRWTSSRKMKHLSPFDLVAPELNTSCFQMQIIYSLYDLLGFKPEEIICSHLHKHGYATPECRSRSTNAETCMTSHVLHTTCMHTFTSNQGHPPPLHSPLTLIYRSCYVHALRSEVDILSSAIAHHVNSVKFIIMNMW